jgi:hypothetical protein
LAKKTVEECIALCRRMFEKQSVILPLWQTLAENFYPERADFTMQRSIGDELADTLVDSYPILVRRDLGNSIAAMMRDGEWFTMGLRGESPDQAGKEWLQWSTGRLRDFMYDRRSGFVRACKEADHDYVTFGQPVLSVERNRNADGLLYRTWHLRDCAWFDDETGQIAGVARKWRPEYHQLVREFGQDKIHPQILQEMKTGPKAMFNEADIRHLVIPADMYGDEKLQERFKYVSLYIDVKNTHLIEEVGLNYHYYVIPRFQTVAGSPYAYSPATVAGLPDARTLQAMTHTILEAGERMVRPPIVATSKVIRGDVDLNPDGITWVDDEYDERLGAALRPLTQDRNGFPIGLEMRQNIVDILGSAFYLNKINLPETSHEMTAYEVQERMKQFRRENMPLFSPIEAEYNGQLCELSFQIALNSGFLGSPYDIPKSLRGADVEFQFESPISQADEEKKANLFAQVSQLVAGAAQFDEATVMNIDFDTALRDAISGVGAPQTWLKRIEEVAQGRQAIAMQSAMQGAMEAQAAQAEVAAKQPA